jgi:hypothetical protein
MSTPALVDRVPFRLVSDGRLSDKDQDVDEQMRSLEQGLKLHSGDESLRVLGIAFICDGKGCQTDNLSKDHAASYDCPGCDRQWDICRRCEQSNNLQCRQCGASLEDPTLPDLINVVILDDSLERSPGWSKGFHTTHHVDGTYWINDSLHRRVLHFESNFKPNTLFRYSPHGFVDAFLHAYNYHLDLVLSPDDLNTHVNLCLSKYINQNPESMRAIFVNHQDKKKLIIDDFGTDTTGWTQFFRKMQERMRSEVKQELVSLMENDFTTSGPVEIATGAAIIMSSFSKYFEYERGMRMCGIRRVHFLGVREDWANLQHKFEQLAQVFESFDKYLQFYYLGLVDIVKKWIDTFDDQPDLDWWNGIMDSQHVRRGSAGGVDVFSGWICRLFLSSCVYQQVHRNYFDTDSATVDVNVQNHQTNTQYLAKVQAGWVGLTVDNMAVRPTMGVGVYQAVASTTDTSLDEEAHQRVLMVIEQNREAFHADYKGGQLNPGWWYLYADGHRVVGAQTKDALYELPDAEHALEHLKPVVFHAVDTPHPIERVICL